MPPLRPCSKRALTVIVCLVVCLFPLLGRSDEAEEPAGISIESAALEYRGVRPGADVHIQVIVRNERDQLTTDAKVVIASPPGVALLEARTDYGSCRRESDTTITCSLYALDMDCRADVWVTARAPETLGEYVNLANLVYRAWSRAPVIIPSAARFTVMEMIGMSGK